MKKRRSVRYDTQILPKSLCKVTVSWGVDLSAEAEVANFCTHGMKVILPPLEPPAPIPKKHDTIKVKLPIVQVWLTGKCIYATVADDGSVAMGICYLVPIAQNDLNELLYKTFKSPLRTCSSSCLEWEDLAGRQCPSEDSIDLTSTPDPAGRP